MPPRDLAAAGLAGRERRAWLARAKAAPPPPARADRFIGRPLDPAAHAAAIAAALQRGHSSLEEVRTMAKVHVTQVPPPARSGRVSCAVCGMNMPPAHPAHPVCGPCAEDPDASRARLATRRRAIERQRDGIEEAFVAAITALDEKDAARWATITELMTATDPARRERYARIRTALLDPASPQVSDALRRVYGADEVAFWGRQGAEAELRRVDVAAAHLEGAIDTLAAAAERASRAA